MPCNPSENVDRKERGTCGGGGCRPKYDEWNNVERGEEDEKEEGNQIQEHKGYRVLDK